MVFVWGGLLLDLLIVPLLLWRRSRVIAFAFALAFHGINSLLFRIGIFPWLMIAASTLFFEPDWPRRVSSRFALKGSTSQESGTKIEGRMIVPVLCVFFLIQFTVPLRHFLYPGYPNWTEEGHRFSWHMKLRDKSGTAQFDVVDGSGDTRTVDPHSVLTERQASEMATHPDMILQFAHYLGKGGASVHARVFVSLNGRWAEPLVDPTVDLARERRSILDPARFLLPLKAPLPTPYGGRWRQSRRPLRH
jgi:hypothetical protein